MTQDTCVTEVPCAETCGHAITEEGKDLSIQEEGKGTHASPGDATGRVSINVAACPFLCCSGTTVCTDC